MLDPASPQAVHTIPAFAKSPVAIPRKAETRYLNERLKPSTLGPQEYDSARIQRPPVFDGGVQPAVDLHR